MIRITALNESSSDDSSQSQGLELVTKEAQEEQALQLYNKALECQQNENYEEAETHFKELLETDLLSRTDSSDKLNDVMQPSLKMKYSSYKNLASISLNHNKNTKAMEYLLEAVNIDNTDVSLWFKVGGVAMKIHNYPLARLSFEEGLTRNKNHWPCLDKLITVLYILNDYAACLSHISRGLKRESGFLKGLAIRDAIFKEQPSLREDIKDFYTNCDSLSVETKYDLDIGKKFIDEALEMRQKRRELAKPKPKPTLKFQQPLVSYTWKNLGERLCELYNHVSKSPYPITPGCPVDLQSTLNLQSVSTVSVNNAADSDTSPSSSMSQTPFSQSLLMTMSPSSQVPSSQPQTPSSPTKFVSAILPLSVGTTPQASEVMEVDTEGLVTSEFPIDESGGLKRSSKRKRQKDEFAEMAFKRRSTRVRNTGKKNQENVNYYELLQEFLPLEIRIQEDEYDNATPPIVECDNHITNDHHYGHSGFQVDCSPRMVDCSPLQASEESNVKEFLKKYQSGQSLANILYAYVIEIGLKANFSWPPGLIDVFMSAYLHARNHFEHPDVIFQDVDDEYIKNEALATLTYNEFKMDKWQSSKSKSLSSPVLSPRSHITTMLGPNFPGKYFLNDLEFIMQSSVRDDILQDSWYNFAMRGHWLRARYFILQSDIDQAIRNYDQMIDLFINDDDNQEIKIVNCSSENIITKDNVQKQMDSVRRCQSLEEVQRLYDQKSYQDVVRLLVTTFNEKQHIKHKISSDIPERHAQLLLLQDSLLQLKDFQKCIEYCELALNEALQQYTIVSGITARTNWGNTMTELLEGFENCLKQDLNIVKCLPMKQLKRLYQNLIKVISLQMNGPELASEMCVNTLLPWIILYRLIQNHEIQNKKDVLPKDPVKDAKDVNTSTETKPVPCSLLILFTAHECLGRRSWCCCFDGKFLLTMTELLFEELRHFSWINQHPNRVEIENNLEQCFFCLYGHPNKKNRAKHLQEHGSLQVPLVWEKAQVIFEYFKPYEVPEFDSFKTSTISSEVENLLRRIVTLIPPQNNQPNTSDSVMAYIEGSNDKPPCVKEKNKMLVVDEIYYLLADYYFKNKEQGKAIKYYILDICINPDRMDSWAGMALARSSQIEQKLNSTDLKMDGPIYRKASAALRCFRRAVEIDKTNITLWIEYGSLAYQMQAYSSRQLKQKEQFNLSQEIVEMLIDKKKEMLDLAYYCFKTANNFKGTEELWLQHYMLGKIAQKKTLMEPKTYLDHFKQAAYHLHKEGARYPKKINYHNPPYISLESLEVFYKIHTSTLRFLMTADEKSLTESNLQYVHKFLCETADSPFAKFQELKVINKFEGELEKESNKSLSSDNFLTDANEKAKKNADDHVLVAIDVLDYVLTRVANDGTSKDSSKTDGKSKLVDSDSSNEVQRKDDVILEEPPKKEHKDTFNKQDLIRTCVAGIKQCLIRFPQHYKSIYSLSHYYFNASQPKVQLAADYLIGSSAVQKSSRLVCPSLFCERKNTNFFNGIWRIPVDEIDRPGSFVWHMYRSAFLLGKIVKGLNDMSFFAHLTSQLHRTPDVGKKYMRDIDRTHLADQMYLECVDILRVKMDSLMQEEPPPTEDRILNCLLEIYKTWQVLHKNVPDPDHINDLLEEAYTMYKLGEVDVSPPVLEQAISFSQTLLQTQIEKARIMHQQKLILQQQRVIEQTLLSAGIQPCTSTNYDLPSSSSGTNFPGTS